MNEIDAAISVISNGTILNFPAHFCQPIMLVFNFISQWKAFVAIPSNISSWNCNALSSFVLIRTERIGCFASLNKKLYVIKWSSLLVLKFNAFTLDQNIIFRVAKKNLSKKVKLGKKRFLFFLVSPFMKKFEGIRASKVVQLLSLVVKRTSRSKPRLKTGSHELEAEQQVWRELTRATRG